MRERPARAHQWFELGLNLTLQPTTYAQSLSLGLFDAKGVNSLLCDIGQPQTDRNLVSTVM